MKFKILLFGKLLLIIISISISSITKAQSPTYELRVANESQPSPKTYEFEVFLLRTGATPLELQTFQFGLGWDTTILNGGDGSYSIVTVHGNTGLPTPTEFVASQPNNVIPANGGGIVYEFNGIKYRYFNCTAVVPPGSGNGTIISSVNGGCTHPGTRVARFRITNSVPFRSNSTCKHIWSTNFAMNRTNTIIQAYPAGGGGAINITNHASNIIYNQSGSCIIQPNGLVVNPICITQPTANSGGPYSSCGIVQLSGSVGGSATGGTWSSPTGGTFIPNATTLNAKYVPSAIDILNGSVMLTLTSNNPNGAPCIAAVSSAIFSLTPVVNDNNACTQDVCNTTNGITDHIVIPIVDDGNLCTIDGCNSSTGLFHTPVCVTLSLKIYLEGYYTGSGLMDNNGIGGCLYHIGVPGASFTDMDTLFISAMNGISYLEVNRKWGILQTNGNVTVTFDAAVIAGNFYYIKIKHRNSLETWCKLPILFTTTTYYDFTTSSTQAYDDGLNIPIKLIDTSPNRWAFYNGDISRDGTIDSQDMTIEEFDGNGGAFGYIPSDLNGDGASDALDMTIIEDNANVGIFEAHP